MEAAGYASREPSVLASRHRRPGRVSPYALLVPAVATWWGADLIQHSLPPSLSFALLDECAHIAVAVTCALWLVPGWGYGPVVLAAVSAASIDIDHVIAAQSIATDRMMALGARPPTHGLPAAVSLALLVSILAGRRAGFTVLIGLVSHVVRDATGPPGVPLLAPFVADQHVTLPFLDLLATVLTFSGIGALLDTLGRRWEPKASQ